MMREKLLLTSFYIANTLDVVTTGIGLNLNGIKEINPGARDLFSVGEMDKVLIGKVAATAVFVGICALAAKENSKWKWSADKAMKIGNYLVWGGFAWNLLNIGLALKG